jgi:hypothetical protein
MESLKSVDDGPMNDKAAREAMGADEYDRLMKGSGDVFSAINFNLYSVNPRMSYIAKEDEDSDPAFWRPKPAAMKPAAPSASAKPASGQ